MATGHLAVSRFSYDVEFEFVIGWDVAAILLVLVTVVLAVVDPQHLALHDRIAGTRVVRFAPVTP